MVRKTELTLAEKLALLAQYGKAHGISTTANDIAHATGETPTNIRRILSGEKANPGLRTLTAITSHFGVGLGYFDCQTKGDVRAYLAQLESSKAREAVSDAELLAQITQWTRGLRPKGLMVLKRMAGYLKRLENDGKSMR